MNSKAIKTKLDEMGYSNNIITIQNDGTMKVAISGNVHVQEVKDVLDVNKWEYKGNEVIFIVK